MYTEAKIQFLSPHDPLSTAKMNPEQVGVIPGYVEYNKKKKKSASTTPKKEVNLNIEAEEDLSGSSLKYKN